MKLTAKLLSVVLILSVAQGCALRKKEGTTFVVAQQASVTTTTEFVDSPEQRAVWCKGRRQYMKGARILLTACNDIEITL